MPPQSNRRCQRKVLPILIQIIIVLTMNEDTKQIAESRIHKVLLRIFQTKIEKNMTLDENEKQIVQNAKVMEGKSPDFDHMCRCFLESDLK